MNVLATIRRVALRSPDQVAVRHGDRELTYRELLDLSGRFAAFLLDRGIQPGQRVGILMHNQLEYLITILGTWQAGGCLVPYNYLFHPGALRHITADTDVRLVVTPGDDVQRLREAVGDLPVNDRILSVGAADGARWTWDDAMSSPAARRVVPRLDGDDAILMYTSGSTGNPKGVRQTHRNIAAACEGHVDWLSITPTDHVLLCTPLFHVGGLQYALPVLFAGGTVTLRRWNVREYLDDARRLQPTILALVPAMMIDILNELNGAKFPLPSVRVCAVGGSALPASKLAALGAATGIVPVNGYGQTEQVGMTVSEPLDEPRRAGALGKPLDQIVQVRIVSTDGTGTDVPVGQVGELWVRGDTITPGYWNLEEASAARFTDGWFRTSDLVRADADGFLYYVDRTDDLIISGGENVFPQMVEAYLAACPLIAEVAVIATPHERLYQQVTAIVVPSKPGVAAEDIAAYCEAQPNLRGLQRPRRIELVDTIPRTATNKIDRPLLRRTFT